MLVQSIEIEGFRSIKKARLELGSLNILIGPNQSGKTNLLDALDLLANLATNNLDGALRDRGGLHNILWAGDTNQVILRVTFSNKNKSTSAYSISLEAHPQGHIIAEESVDIEGPSLSTTRVLEVKRGEGFVISQETKQREALSFGALHKEPALLQLRSPTMYRLFEAIREALSWIVVYPGFETLPKWANLVGSDLRDPQPTEHASILEPDGGNLVNVLHTLQSSSTGWEEFLAFLRLGFPHLKGLAFPPAEQGKIGLAWQDKRFPRKQFWANVLSDGTLRFLALSAALCSLGAPTLTAIEEPESHLHPELLYRFVGLLEQASAQRQILLTTHSDALLSYLSDPSMVVIATNGEEGTTFTRPPTEDLKEWLKTYTLGQLREAGHLLAFAEASNAA